MLKIVSQWSYNPPSGLWLLGTDAKDSSGNGNDGTAHGGVTFGQAGPVAGTNATLFDGSSGYISTPNGAVKLNGTTGYGSVPDTANLRVVTSPFTWVVWVKTTTPLLAPTKILGKTHYTAGLILMYTDGTNHRVQLDISPDQYVNFTSVDQLSGPNIDDGNWHLICVSFDRVNKPSIFIDDALVISSVTGSTNLTGAGLNPDSPANLVIGSDATDADGGGSRWPGYLAGVSTLKTALNLAQVKSLYNAGSPANYVALLKSYGATGIWMLDDLDTVIRDTSGNGDNGVPVGTYLVSQDGPPQLHSDLNVGVGPYTFGLWSKTTSTANIAMGKTGDYSGAVFGYMFNGPQSNFVAGPLITEITPDGYTNWIGLGTNEVFNDGSWSFYVLSDDRVTAPKVYVNGSQAAVTHETGDTAITTAGWDLTNTFEMTLGNDGNHIAEFGWDGAEAGIFLRKGVALSAAQVLALYQNGPVTTDFHKHVLVVRLDSNGRVYVGSAGAGDQYALAVAQQLNLNQVTAQVSGIVQVQGGSQFTKAQFDAACRSLLVAPGLAANQDIG